MITLGYVIRTWNGGSYALLFLGTLGAAFLFAKVAKGRAAWLASLRGFLVAVGGVFVWGLVTGDFEAANLYIYLATFWRCVYDDWCDIYSLVAHFLHALLPFYYGHRLLTTHNRGCFLFAALPVLVASAMVFGLTHTVPASAYRGLYVIVVPLVHLAVAGLFVLRGWTTTRASRLGPGP